MKLETKLASEYLKSSLNADSYFLELQKNHQYLNELYKDLNDNLWDLETDELVDAYYIAVQAIDLVLDSQRKLPYMHKYTLEVKKMFLSGSSSKLYAMLYRQ